jgi:small-conductance mechanosensitive channel
VADILKRCAAAHPAVLAEPPPKVFLESFGDNGLAFALRISLPDIDKAYEAQSDLRIAILKAFRDEGIDIPFTQVDVTLRDLETMRRYVDDAMERLKKAEA